jgi:hypothetical protein
MFFIELQFFYIILFLSLLGREIKNIVDGTYIADTQGQWVCYFVILISLFFSYMLHFINII